MLSGIDPDRNGLGTTINAPPDTASGKITGEEIARPAPVRRPAKE